MTLPEFAEAAGAKKRTAIDWQNGASSPTATQLALLAKAGVDVRYVITGERLTVGEMELERRLKAVSHSAAQAQAIPGLTRVQQSLVQAAIFDASVQALAEDEQRVIHHYRNAGDAGRAAIAAAAASLANSQLQPERALPEKAPRGPKVQQSFHGSVGQVGGGDIVNKGSRK